MRSASCETVSASGGMAVSRAGGSSGGLRGPRILDGSNGSWGIWSDRDCAHKGGRCVGFRRILRGKEAEWFACRRVYGRFTGWEDWWLGVLGMVMERGGGLAALDSGMDRAGERTLIHRGRKFDFESVTVDMGGGRRVTREVVRHPGAVVVVPVLEGGRRVVLIRNERIALGKVLWECPAGTLEPPEDAAVCAMRELEEEAGYRAGKVVGLGSFYTTPGMTDELMHSYAAVDLEKTAQDLEEDERIEVHAVEVDEVFGMIDDGRLMDAKSMLAVLLAERKGVLKRGER